MRVDLSGEHERTVRGQGQIVAEIVLQSDRPDETRYRPAYCVLILRATDRDRGRRGADCSRGAIQLAGLIGRLRQSGDGVCSVGWLLGCVLVWVFGLFGLVVFV